MSITRNLGGDRLGSGAKMNVELHNYNRSTHDLSKIWRSTMACGTLVPFLTEIALPGDTHDINLNTMIRTVPTLAPLFGSFKVQLDVFSVPIRLYNASLHMNRLNIGMNMSSVKLPMMNLCCSGATHPDTFDPSSLVAYLGVRGAPPVRNGGVFPDTNNGVRKNALFLLAYWDIYKNYYANKQEKIGVVIGNASNAHWTVKDFRYQDSGGPFYNSLIDENTGAINPPYAWDSADGSQSFRFVAGDAPAVNQLQVEMNNGTTTQYYNLTDIFTVTTALDTDYLYLNITPKQNINGWIINQIIPPKYTSTQESLALIKFPLENIDEEQLKILQHAPATPYLVNGETSKQPYKQCLGITWPAVILSNYSSQNGLGVKTYQSDLFNNWLDTTFIEDITSKSSVSTATGSFSIDALNFSKKVYDMLNRVAVAGGSYNDWQEAIWSEESFRLPESPVYCGGLSTELIFEEVVSTADATTTEGDVPLGSLAGRGTQSQKRKGGHIYIKTSEPSLILGIVSITPRIDYSQGNKWFTNLQTMDDFHKPALDGIGFQELITEQMAHWDCEYDDVTDTFTFKSAGKQPAWINYMTSYNEVFGNFAKKEGDNALMQCVLNRDYAYDSVNMTIKDLTTYVDPVKYNYAFAQTDLSAQNFWVQIACDITARRKMSAKIIPNL